MLTGQLGPISPPVQAHGGQLGEVGSSRTTESAGTPSLRRVRVPLVESLLGTSNFLLPDPKGKMCLLSYHWSFHTSPGADPKPALALETQGLSVASVALSRLPGYVTQRVSEQAGEG